MQDRESTREAYIFLPGENGDFQRETKTLRALAELNRSHPLDGTFADRACDWLTVRQYCENHKLPYQPFNAGDDRIDLIKNFTTQIHDQKGSVRVAIIADVQSPPYHHGIIEALGGDDFDVSLRHV